MKHPITYIKSLSVEKIKSFIDWIIEQSVELETLNIERDKIKVMMPYYMQMIMTRYAHEIGPTMGYYGDSTEFMLHGLKYSFDSPTHDAYVYTEDWCMYPDANFRRVLPLFG
jgi:hypothetical protein